MTRRFYISDVFHTGLYSGNQLATVIDTKDLSDTEMQKIARAFNFPETTFYFGGNLEDGFNVRIFTPAEEVPFAGHPSLGTAFLLNHHIEQLNAKSLVLNLKIGKIPIAFDESGVIWMKQPAPVFGEVFSAQTAADCLNISINDIDTDYPAQLVSTGLEFLMIPLRTLDALKRVRVLDSPALGTFCFCKESYSPDYAIAARMFAPEVGVSEDPATGSANGCLASYIVEHEYFGSRQVDIKVAQGFEINRPSALYLKADKNEGVFDINIGGEVRLVAEGKLL
jgi:trans-2,3-dihydro-3-hydroxyanthranilate isomerase